jgi:hypothetical protein
MSTAQQYGSQRHDGTNGTAVTSADTKIGYSPDTDETALFILGDINAMPEGQEPLDDWYGTAEHVADSLVYNAVQHADGETADIAVTHHPDTYTDQGWTGTNGSWLRDDKQTVYNAVITHPAIGEVYDVVDPVGQLAVDSGDIAVDGTTVDGYVNLHDRGEDLLRALDYDPDAIARGANPPTAVWNNDSAVQDYTDKRALLETVSDLADDVDNIYTPAFDTVDTAADVIRFGHELYGDDWLDDPDPDETVILKADPDATWGDAVLALDPTKIVTEYETRKRREGYNGGPDIDQVATEILGLQARREADRVSAMHNRPNDHTLLEREDGTWRIMQQNPDTGEYEPGTGIVEEAIAGTVERDGATYHIGTVGDRQYDLVPLSVTDPDSGNGVLRAVTVRTANSTNLNVNRNGHDLDSFDIHPLKDAFYGFLGEELEDDAGRQVQFHEVSTLLHDAADIITETRHRTAYDAEQQLR